MYIACAFFVMVSYFLLPRRTMFLCYGTLEKDFSTLYFRVNYIVEVFTLMTSVTTAVTACDTLFFYFAWHIYVEFSLLKIAFQKWNEQQITDRKQFTEAVKHHDFLLNFVNDLNEVYSFLFLFQYFLSLIGICFGLFMLTRKGLVLLKIKLYKCKQISDYHLQQKMFGNLHLPRRHLLFRYLQFVRLVI